MKYIFMYEHPFDFKVKRMAEALEASRSGYYAWVRAGLKTKTETEDEYLLEVIVERLMRENNIVPKTVRKFKATTYSNHDYPVSPNILNKNFNVAAPNMAWVSDISYVATDEGWLYLVAVMDLYSGKIVGWAMGSLMTQQLVCDALNQSVRRARPPRGVVCHSVRGVQYASKSYRTLLKKHGFIQSMSRKGNC